MKMKKIFALSILSLCITFIGCKKGTNEEVDETETTAESGYEENVEEQEESPETSPAMVDVFPDADEISPNHNEPRPVVIYDPNSETNRVVENTALIGVWDWANAKDDIKADIAFNADGTFAIHAVKGKTTKEEQTVKGTWTSNNDKIYMVTPGESEVAILDILSIDDKSLVLHFPKEPSDNLQYYIRRN